MPNNFKSLLPPSATTQEQAIEQACDESTTTLPVTVRDSKNPDTCPEDQLPWLAWEYGVDVWNSAWSIERKRAAVKRAKFIHQHRGTKAAIMRSLEESPFSPSIKEWYELTPQGEPYTFELTALQEDKPFTQSDIQDLKNAVLRGKNLRSWFGVVLRSARKGTAYAAGAVRQAEFVSVMPLFEIYGFYVNGWQSSTFAPKTSFEGATYTILYQGNVGDITWTITGGSAVTTNGAVTIKQPGSVTVTGTDAKGRVISHTINPTLWFVQDNTKGLIKNVEQWAITMWGRVPLIDELVYGRPMSGRDTKRGNFGTLWSEWGDMAVYGWPGAPAPGTTWADWWTTLSVVEDSPLAVWIPVLASKHNRAEEFSSNGTIATTLLSNANEFRRLAVWDTTTPFVLKGCGVNGWFYTDFAPITSFNGAKYRLYVVGHGGKPITWKVTGPATITVDGWITITGPGAVSITGKNYRGETITHAINPQKYLIPSPGQIVAAQFSAFLASTGGAHARNIDLTLGTYPVNARGIGALWNEWGDMSAYGWPVYRAPNVATYWNAKPSETFTQNTVFLNNGNYFNLAADPNFLFCIAAVIIL
jgi:phage tail P2-like protein